MAAFRIQIKLNGNLKFLHGRDEIQAVGNLYYGIIDGMGDVTV